MHCHIKFGTCILQLLGLVIAVVTVDVPGPGLHLPLIEFEVAKVKEHGFGDEHLHGYLQNYSH